MLGEHSETIISPQAAVGENGTFTNFVNIGAAPFRMIGKLAKPVETADEPLPKNKRKWIPLHTLTYIATAITFILLCFPWETNYRNRYWGHGDREAQLRAEALSARYASYPGFIQTDTYDEVPFVLVLPILAILSQLAKFRTRMHPFRWFVMVVACFVGLFVIPALIRSPSIASMIYIGTLALLAFEYLCFIVARLLCAEAKLLRNVVRK